jgi:hypothetical protein
MKHIKPFNEDITSFNFEEDLQDFCEMNLAYLLDEGTKVSVGETQNGNYVKIKFDKMKSWDEIKDHIIPFVTRLNNKYEMERNPMIDYDPVRIWTYVNLLFNHLYTTRLVPGTGSMTRKIEDLINDDVWKDIQPQLILDIDIYIKGYKQEKKSVLTKIKSFFK